MSPLAVPIPDRPQLPDVVAEHLEEHGFLSLQRRKLLFSLDYPARRLAEHDERITAHWQGLVVNRSAGAELSEKQLTSEDPWTLASAARAWMALARPDSERIREVWSGITEEQLPSWREALRGLGTAPLEEAVPARVRNSLEGPALALVVDALGWQGELDATLAARAARHPEATVRASLARFVHLQAEEVRSLHAPLLGDPEAPVRRRALWSLALTEPEAGVERARAGARGKDPDPFAVRVLGLLGGPDDIDAVAAAAATDSGRVPAVHAFSDLGTRDALEALIRLLSVPDEPFALEVTAALERALGPIPRKDDESPAAPSEAAALRDRVTESLPSGARALGGLPRPWGGDPEDEPCLWVWRGAVGGAGTRGGRRRGRERHEDEAARRSWRREVPDGFFGGYPVADARPGE